MLNKVVLVGRITKDPELRQTSSGISFVYFTIAADSPSRNADGSYERKADFISCVAWRSSAEFLGKYIKKGAVLCVEGKIQSRSYTPQGESQVRYVTEVVADSVQSVSSSSRDSSSSSSNTNYQSNTSNEVSGDMFKDTYHIDVDDDDLPF